MLEKGQVIPVEEPGWIKIMNPGISSENAYFTYGDFALMIGGKIEIVEVTNDNRVLALYKASEGIEVTGTMCPSGALFLLPVHQVEAWLKKQPIRIRATSVR
jgi:hypothetical protein